MNEIEKQFFECIGIEPKKLFSARQGINPDAVIYPEITDRKLLELIELLRQHFNLYFWGKNTFDLREQNRGLNCYFRTGGTIKNAILQSYLCVIADEELNNEKLKQQVKALFEDKEQ